MPQYQGKFYHRVWGNIWKISDITDAEEIQNIEQDERSNKNFETGICDWDTECSDGIAIYIRDSDCGGHYIDFDCFDVY